MLEMAAAYLVEVVLFAALLITPTSAEWRRAFLFSVPFSEHVKVAVTVSPAGAVSSFVPKVTCLESFRDLSSADPVQSRFVGQPGPAQHTVGHLECPACRAATIEAMSQAELGHEVFEHVATYWLEQHRQYIAAGTVVDYQCSIKALDGFLHGTVLDRLEIGTFREYQRHRLALGIGPSRINHETSCLGQIAAFAIPEHWARIKPLFRPLRVPKRKIGQAMSDEAEDRLFRVARTRKRWRLAYWCSSLMANTAARPVEIRHLRLRAVNLAERHINIEEGLKTADSVRRVPLNETAYKQLCRIHDRYVDLCAEQHRKPEPDDFILPHRAHVRGAGWDFSKPMGSWRKAWEALRKEAGMPTLRMYDLRHHAITKMLENPAIPLEAVKAVAGHNAVSKVTEEVYSHIRKQAKIDAVAALDPANRKPSRAELEIVQNRGRYST